MGEVAEWPNAAASRKSSRGGYRVGGSNPSPLRQRGSAIKRQLAAHEVRRRPLLRTRVNQSRGDRQRNVLTASATREGLRRVHRLPTERTNRKSECRLVSQLLEHLAV